jgi:hypothetical protein
VGFCQAKAIDFWRIKMPQARISAFFTKPLTPPPALQGIFRRIVKTGHDIGFIRFFILTYYSITIIK